MEQSIERNPQWYHGLNSSFYRCSNLTSPAYADPHLERQQPATSEAMEPTRPMLPERRAPNKQKKVFLQSLRGNKEEGSATRMHMASGSSAERQLHDLSDKGQLTQDDLSQGMSEGVPLTKQLITPASSTGRSQCQRNLQPESFTRTADKKKLLFNLLSPVKSVKLVIKKGEE